MNPGDRALVAQISQSAVSQISMRQRRRSRQSARNCERRAEWNPAIRQSETPRYGSGPGEVYAACSSGRDVSGGCGNGTMPERDCAEISDSEK